MKTTSSKIILFSLSMLLTHVTLAEPLSSISLKLEKIKKSVVDGESVLNLDLLNEAKRQNPVLQNIANLDLNRVEVLAKSNIGGAGVHLVVNNIFVDSQSLETDPSLYRQDGGEQKVELKNTERRASKAGLQVIGDAKVKSVTVFFGEISMPALLGAYAAQDASAVAQAVPEAEPVVSIRAPEYLRPGATGAEVQNPAQQLAPEPAVTPVTPAPATRPPMDILPPPPPGSVVKPPVSLPSPAVPVTPVPAEKTRPAQLPPSAPMVITPVRPASPVQTAPRVNPEKSNPAPAVPARPKVQAAPRVQEQGDEKPILDQDEQDQEIEQQAPQRREPPRRQAPRQPSARELWMKKNCIGQICIGDQVANSFGFYGRVIAAYPNQQSFDVDFGFVQGTSRRPVHQLRLISVGRRP